MWRLRYGKPLLSPPSTNAPLLASTAGGADRITRHNLYHDTADYTATTRVQRKRCVAV